MQSLNKNKFNIAKKIFWEGEISTYELQILKKMQVRRLSPIHRVVLDLSFANFDFSRIDSVVHASQHGELSISTDLIAQILNGEVPSPIKFSQSTHNALSGQLSIFSKYKFPINALSSGSKTISMGILSALTKLLSSDDQKNVLFIYSEMRPNEILGNLLNIDNQVGIILFEKGDQFNFNIGKFEMNEREFDRFKNWSGNDLLQLSSIEIFSQ